MNYVFRKKIVEQFGFTLLEVLITVGILAILGTVGFGYYRNYAQQLELQLASKALVADLRTARARAMSGDAKLNWGVHAVNGSSQYYEIYSTPTNYSDPGMTVDSTVYLVSAVVFSNPGTSSSIDVLFNKTTGTTSTNSLTVISEGSPVVVTITSDGTVY